MQKIFFYSILFFSLTVFSQQETSAYKSGEWLKFRMHYGIINAGFASIEINDTINNNQEVFHVIGKGWTTGVTKFFFNVEDNYQTWFYKNNSKPYHFRRRVDEGGHIISRDVYFNQAGKTALIKDHKKKKEKTMPIDNVQDMISSFYYLRSHDINKMVINDEIGFKMFFDYESFDFKMKYLGNEIIDSKFGKVKCHKFRPLVQSGRVFEEEESLTIWVTADKNKIPIRIKADLVVGSLKADLDEFKGLANPFNIIYKN